VEQQFRFKEDGSVSSFQQVSENDQCFRTPGMLAPVRRTCPILQGLIACPIQN
jgi:hypothetical protein